MRPAKCFKGISNIIHYIPYRLPGWGKNSYGYSGYSGKKVSDVHFQPYGPTFKENDVIGCGVIDGKCFFTKNGEFLGVAFRNLPQKLSPAVDLRFKGWAVHGNFGQRSFQYDLDWEKLRSICK